MTRWLDGLIARSIIIETRVEAVEIVSSNLQSLGRLQAIKQSTTKSLVSASSEMKLRAFCVPKF